MYSVQCAVYSVQYIVYVNYRFHLLKGLKNNCVLISIFKFLVIELVAFKNLEFSKSKFA